MEWRAHKLDNEIPRINRAAGSPWNVSQHVICCGKRKNQIMPCKWDCYFAIETQSLYLSATSENNSNNILHRSRDILKISLMSLALVVRWSKTQVDCVRTFIRYQPKFIFDNTIWICIWISIKTSRFQGNNCLHFKLTPRYPLTKVGSIEIAGVCIHLWLFISKTFNTHLRTFNEIFCQVPCSFLVWLKTGLYYV